MRSPQNARNPNFIKSSDRDQNLFSSEGDYDTPARQIPGHSFQMFSSECPESQLH